MSTIPVKITDTKSRQTTEKVGGGVAFRGQNIFYAKTQESRGVVFLWK